MGLYKSQALRTSDWEGGPTNPLSSEQMTCAGILKPDTCAWGGVQRMLQMFSLLFDCSSIVIEDIFVTVHAAVVAILVYGAADMLPWMHTPLCEFTRWAQQDLALLWVQVCQCIIVCIKTLCTPVLDYYDIPLSASRFKP